MSLFRVRSVFRAAEPAIDELPLLRRVLVQLSEKYKDMCGYRKYGLKLDDLWVESRNVQTAINRLPETEIQDRAFRLKRAVDANFHNDYLPKEHWTKAEEDKPYLLPLVAEVQAEQIERTEYK
ncbi:mitochondrial Complex III (CIII) ubiquinol:cytochrome c oxidoreductase Qcr7 [Andalucia godoyi]|uniref:Cytochrome b-c1 complex subunit 7 n=1 Tax=Andalucia godoyi TaxID=505711 RepID=A0A8K0F4N0_ANDGO|nr:mitochondrial Complex III (CIII) ubiquinol:cytochrome c oxidoreductase Qcr7 [Andalucia godoyi]|eukprot:ANDGO_05256.mRNA.1 mitochondrial Complex III (CIII) ubiquinol:cytochrome c oxidoreductase Qcr7